MTSKSRFEDLAICGTAPAFASPLHVGRPNLPDRERLLSRINEVLDRNWLSNNGPCVQEFEQRLADLLGVKHCIAMSNGTMGLEIAARALDFTGEVIVPSMTFIATAHALQWQQITPVFCDIDCDTHNLDPRCIEESITPRTTGIIGVHLWGRACDVAVITEIARRRRLRLVFDAAHAFACTCKGRPVGGAGDAEVFSFHATKFFNTFEGGAVATNDDQLARKIRLMKNFGFSGYDSVIHVGINGKMTEPAAAMGLASLESIEDFRAINRRNYQAYAARLGAISGLRLLPYDEKEQNNYQYIVIEVDQRSAILNRDEVQQVLHAENVLARRYFYPGCHRMEPYRTFYPLARWRLPVTEAVVGRVLVLPTGASIGEVEIRTICDILTLAITNPDLTRNRLSAMRRSP
jgi:dTDP-4-amino-4,6-dideoxygalactose transaminase